MTKIIADQSADATSDVPGPEFLPLRGLANILVVLLAVVVAFIWARLAIRLLSPGSLRYFTDLQLDKTADITLIGLSILFVVWFYRARINAEQHGASAEQHLPVRRLQIWPPAWPRPATAPSAGCTRSRPGPASGPGCAR